MAILGIIKALLGLLSMFVGMARDRKLIDQGRAQEMLRNLEKTNELLGKADKARDAALSDFDKRDGVPDEHDPNLRD